VLFLSVAGYVMMLACFVFVCECSTQPALRCATVTTNDSEKGVNDRIFPIELAWISSLFLMVGGGQRIFNSMIFTLVSDSLGHSNRQVKNQSSKLYVFSPMSTGLSISICYMLVLTSVD